MYSDGETRADFHSARRGRRARSWHLGEVVLKRLLSKLAVGRIHVFTPGGRAIDHCGALDGPQATLVLHRWRAILKLVTGGDIGFADAYLAGDWSSPDLAALIELAAANGPHMERMVAGSLPARVWNQVRHMVRVNSLAGSRRNIAFHYDLGNDFYRLWLDDGMTYSSALYARPDQSLEEAQRGKISRILDLLALKGGESVLEIGCGWGTLAAAIAGTGASVTGLTLSREQRAHAQTLLAREGLSARTDIRLQDYRDVDGRYDRIVSIEMMEAVGEKYWPTYFRILGERLVPGGIAVLQVISIAADRFESYRRSTDFIQRYIFPGGMLPTTAIIAEQAQDAGLELVSVERFGDSYARTLADWRLRFLAASPEVEKLGFDARFQRLWDYYLCYCEAGFRAEALDVGLYVLRK